jgi:hypothetical protein
MCAWGRRSCRRRKGRRLAVLVNLVEAGCAPDHGPGAHVTAASGELVVQGAVRRAPRDSAASSDAWEHRPGSSTRWSRRPVARLSRVVGSVPHRATVHRLRETVALSAPATPREAADESCYLRPRVHVRPGAGEPARRTTPLRGRPGGRRPPMWTRACPGPRTSGPHSTNWSRMHVADDLTSGGVAAGSPGAESAASDPAARRTQRRRRGVREPGRGDRHRDACRPAAAARPRRDCGVRTRPHPGAGPSRPGTGPDAGRTLGRPRMRVAPDRLKEVAGLSVREAALALGLSRSTAQRRMRAGRA